MLEPIVIKPRPVYEDIYDRYSAQLFGITLLVSRNTKQAEEILIQSFRVFFQQKLFPQDDDQIFRHLLRITIHITAAKRNLPKQKISSLIFKAVNQAKRSPVTA